MSYDVTVVTFFLEKQQEIKFDELILETLDAILSLFDVTELLRFSLLGNVLQLILNLTNVTPPFTGVLIL